MAPKEVYWGHDGSGYMSSGMALLKIEKRCLPVFSICLSLEPSTSFLSEVKLWHLKRDQSTFDNVDWEMSTEYP